VASLEQRSLTVITGELASVFGSINLSFECFTRILCTSLILEVNSSFGICFCGLGLISVCFIFLFLHSTKDLKRDKWSVGGTMTVGLWTDINIWLVSGTSITFGLASAWLGGYVNAHYVAVALHTPAYIGCLMAILSAVAAFISWMSCRFVQRSAKAGMILAGSISFLGLVVLTDSTIVNVSPDEWGWGVASFFVLMGIGRGVFESTNKSIYADFFPGVKSIPAFANQMLCTTAGGSLGYILIAQNYVNATKCLIYIVVIVTWPGLLLRIVLHKRQSTALCS